MKKYLVKYEASEYAQRRPEIIARLERHQQNYKIVEHSTHTQIVTNDKNYHLEKPHSGELPRAALSAIRNLRTVAEKSLYDWKRNLVVYRECQNLVSDTIVFREQIPTEASGDIYEVDIKGAYISALQKINILDSDKDGETAIIRKLRATLLKNGETPKNTESICKKVRLIGIGSLAKTLETTTATAAGCSYLYETNKEKPRNLVFDKEKMKGVNLPAIPLAIVKTESEGRTIDEAAKLMAKPKDLFSAKIAEDEILAKTCSNIYFYIKHIPNNFKKLALPSDIFFAAKNIVSKDIDKMINAAAPNLDGVFIKWVDAIFCSGANVAKICEMAQKLGYRYTVTKHKNIIFDERLGMATVELEAEKYKYEINENGSLIINGKKTFLATAAKDKTAIEKVAEYVATANPQILEAHAKRYKNISSAAHLRQTLKRLGINSEEMAELKTEEYFLRLLEQPATTIGVINTLLEDGDIEEVAIGKDRPAAIEYLKAQQKINVEAAMLQYYYKMYRDSSDGGDHLPEHYKNLDYDELQKFGSVVDFCMKTFKFKSEDMNLALQKLQIKFKAEDLDTNLKLDF